MAKRKSYSANDDFVVPDDTSRNGSAAPPSKRSKKFAGETTSSHFSTPSATTPAKRDADNNLYWEISKARRVVLNDFKGKKMISIREYYEKDGNWLPGKKGISMTLEQYGALMGVLPAVDRELRRGGVEDLPRPDYSTSEDYGAVKDEPEDETEASEEEEAAGGGRANHEATSDEEE
ncbi:hypothetical protein LTR70_004238 [Exophiala xenobiotica]|uniref:Transcriptional coactivator p15 (PC4) C-terminal domain-containing protein n=1 Tax=Lithohypha guttulata TaxID=1690604 RepID=A0ABR0KE48_9EURO|nr:hypothetical protein LTR24_003795 [Lithohypha guttulata]KAK5320993.1 hypothetical protein LTR70_004238 [Exophiala xenobiotica]